VYLGKKAPKASETKKALQNKPQEPLHRQQGHRRPENMQIQLSPSKANPASHRKCLHMYDRRGNLQHDVESTAMSS
jgi:hypothetical protein